MFRLNTDVTRLHKRCQVWEISQGKVLSKALDQFFFQSNTNIFLNIVTPRQPGSTGRNWTDLSSEMIDFLGASDCADRIINLAGAKEDVEKIPVDTIQKMKSLEELSVTRKSSFQGALSGVQILFDYNANTLKKLSLLDFHESNSLRIPYGLNNLQSLTLGYTWYREDDKQRL